MTNKNNRSREKERGQGVAEYIIIIILVAIIVLVGVRVFGKNIVKQFNESNAPEEVLEGPKNN